MDKNLLLAKMIEKSCKKCNDYFNRDGKCVCFKMYQMGRIDIDKILLCDNARKIFGMWEKPKFTKQEIAKDLEKMLGFSLNIHTLDDFEEHKKIFGDEKSVLWRSTFPDEPVKCQGCVFHEEADGKYLCHRTDSIYEAETVFCGDYLNKSIIELE